MEAVLKKRRSVLKREKKEQIKLAKKQGAAVASLNNVPTSTRKMRLVADLVRGKKVNIALGILKLQPKSGAARLEVLLLSAISNWQIKNPDLRLEEADLFIKEIFVDGGRMLKRLRPAPQGRGYRVRKRSNHVTLVIDSIKFPGNTLQQDVETAEEKKAEKPAAKKTSSKKEEKKAEPKKSTKKTK
ncbi:MAG: 50S ribosomal protein L22 [Cytophagaceae bacterium]